MRPTLAVCHRPTDELARTLELALSCGDRAGVEVTVDPDDGLVLAPLADALRREGIAARHHFPLCGREISSADEDEAEVAEQTITRVLAFVGDSGGSHLTVHAALPSGSRGSDRFARTSERLARLGEAGARCGVRVDLENLRWGDTADPVAFLTLVESANVGVTLDIGHAASSDSAGSGFGAEQLVTLMSPRIDTAHVYAYEDHDGHHAPYGLHDVEHALRALLQSGCDWWTAELHDPAGTSRTCALLRGFLDEHFAEDTLDADRDRTAGGV